MFKKKMFNNFFESSENIGEISVMYFSIHLSRPLYCAAATGACAYLALKVQQRTTLTNSASTFRAHNYFATTILFAPTIISRPIYILRRQAVCSVFDLTHLTLEQKNPSLAPPLDS